MQRTLQSISFHPQHYSLLHIFHFQVLLHSKLRLQKEYEKRVSNIPLQSVNINIILWITFWQVARELNSEAWLPLVLEHVWYQGVLWSSCVLGAVAWEIQLQNQNCWNKRPPANLSGCSYYPFLHLFTLLFLTLQKRVIKFDWIIHRQAG